jgi:fibronectin-binding autotransporter adhesin
VILASDIATALANGNVTISTGGTAGDGQGNGDITVASAIGKTAAGNTTLTLNAHNNINLNASITSTTGQLNMVFNPDSDTTGGGAVVLGTTTLDGNGGTINAAGKAVSKSAGTASINSTTTIGTLNLTGGTLAGSGAITIANGLTMTNGSINRSGTTSIAGTSSWSDGSIAGGTLTNTGTLYITGATGEAFVSTPSALLQNSGTIIYNKTGGYWRIAGNGGVFTNLAGGTVDLQSDQGVHGYFGTGIINNYGSFTKTSGASTTIGNEVRFNSFGGSSFSVPVGTVLLDGGGKFTGTGDGTGMATGGTTDNGPTLLGGNWSAETNGKLAGKWQWQSGTFNSGTLTNTGTLYITGATGEAFVSTPSALLQNSGTIIYNKTGGYWRIAGNGGVFTNLAGGTVDLQSDRGVHGYFGTGIINNYGSFTKTAGVSTTIGSEVAFNSFGGSSFSVPVGTVLLDGGGKFTGTGDGTGMATGGTTDNGPTLLGGNWSAETNGKLAGKWQWQSGSFNSGTLTNTGTLYITGATGDTFVTGPTVVLQNSGSIVYNKTGTGYWRIAGNGGVFTNLASGTVDLQSDRGVHGFSGFGIINNYGSFTKTSGASTTIGNEVRFNSFGGSSFSVPVGTVLLDGGGKFTGTGDGTGMATGGTTDNGPTLLGGNWSAETNGKLAGKWQWQSGSFNSGTLTNTGTLRITGATGDSFISGASVVLANSGTILYEKTGGFWRIAGSGTLNNLSGGTVELRTDQGIEDYFGAGSISNSGVFGKTAGTSSAIAGVIPFSNTSTGKINVAVGSLSIPSLATNNGSIEVASGTTFQKTGNFTNAGTISGVGTINVGAGSTLTNSGTIRPGGTNSVGTLAITGILSNAASGVLEFELLDNSTQYDKIIATGNVLLGTGTIKANDLAGYRTTSGHIYSIINSSGGSISGTPAFTSATGGAYSGTGSPTFVMTATADGAAQFVWSGAINNFWDDALNWTDNHIPDATELAIIDGAGVKTVEVRSTGGAQSVRGVLFGPTGGYDNLLLSGGSALDIGVSGMTTPSSSALTLSGGTLTATGALNSNGNFTWNAGTITGAGVLNTTGITTFVTGNLTTKTWNNTGTVNVAAGHINLAQTSTFNNQTGGILNLTSIGSFNEVSGGVATVNNSGTLNKTANNSLSIGNGTPISAFNNLAGGVVNVSSGSLVMNSGGGADAGTYTIGAGTALDFNSARSFNSGISFTGSGELRFGGNTQTFNAAHSFAAAGPTLLLNGSTLTSASALTIDAPLTWNAGTITGAGVLNTTGITTFVTGNLTTKTWNNTGTVNVAAGHINLAQTSTFNNQTGGILNLTSIGSFNEVSGGVATVNNSGTLNKTANNSLSIGNGTPISAFNNLAGGVVNVSSGSLVMNSGGGADAGTYTIGAGTALDFNSARSFNSGTSFTGTGELRFGGNTQTFNAAHSFAAAGPTLLLNGSTLTSASALTIDAPLTWNAGTITGAGVLNTTGITTFVTGNLTTKTWNNTGTVNVAAGHINLAQTSTFNNQTGGILNLTSIGSFNEVSGGVATVNNSGTLNKTANNSLSIGNGTPISAFNNLAGGVVNVSSGSLVMNSGGGADAGTYTIGAGTALDFNSARSFNSGISFTGSGELRFGGNTQTFNAAHSFAAAGPTLLLNGSTLTSASALTIDAPLTWNAGTITGAGVLNTTGITTFVTGNLTTKTWNNTGTVNVAAGHINLAQTSTFNNQTGGILNLTSIGSFNEVSGGVATVNNSGTLNKTANNSLSIGNGTPISAFNNLAGGVVNVSSGSLVMNSGGGADAGTYTIGAGTALDFNSARSFNSGISFTGSGELRFGGNTQTFNAAHSFAAAGPTLLLNGSTLTSASALTIDAPLTWNAGTITGTGALNTTGITTFVTGNLTTKTWNNTGTVNVAAGHINLAQTSTFNNQTGGILNLTSIGSFNEVSGGVATVNNSGTLNKTANNSLSIGNGTPISAFNNLAGGVVNVSSGTLDINTAFDQSGTIDLAVGASLSKQGGFSNLGTLRGSGTIDVGVGTLTNNGTISPGVGAGNTATLNITGNLNLVGGTLNIDMGGTTPGLSDKVAVIGNVTMGGILNAAVVGGYVPANADAIPFLSMTGTATGTFAPVNAPANFSAGYNLAGGEAARLIYAVSGTRTFNNSQGNFDWGTALNWTGGLPGASDDALISGSFAVAHAYGTDTIASLTIDPSNSLNVSGGSLSVSGAVTSTGTVFVSGGTLSLNGTSAVSVLNLSSGTLNGGGNLTVSSDFNQTGGVLGSTFASLDLTRSLGHFNIGTYSATNGTVRLATVGAFDITLNGSLQTTNTGLADNVAAIQVSSGRDILMASTANLTSITSGAIKLTAAGGVNLKVDDFGGNGAGNTINAAGNLDVTATAGAIQSTDGNVMNLAAKAITLTAGTSISPSSGGSIAAGSGNLVLTAGGSINTTNYGMSAAQNLTLTGAGINSSGLTATAGQIDINSTGGVTAGALAAGSGITVDGTATISLGALTAGNGLIAVNGTGAATDVILGGTVQATNSGLLINQYGIDISAGRDIRVASTSNLTALTSGGIRLQGGRDVNLKVDDLGGNGAGNAVNAVGNLAITAGSGSIFQDDGNVLSLSGANVALTAATAIGALGNITATIGTVNLGAGTSLSTAGHTVTAPGTISFSAPGTVSVSTLNATGATSDISLTSTTANVSGGSLSAGRHITVNAVTGLTMGGSTAGTGGTGLISFGNTGGASDITLNGSLQTTNTGLADNVAAIQVSSGRDILMASTANLTSITSGAIKLTAAGGVNLKVDDFGGNGAGNTINAAGNLDVTATAGAIQSTDGNVMNLAAKAITLTAGGSISPSSGGSIAAGSGNLVLTAGGSINTTNYGMSAAQNLTLTGAGINSSGLTATAGQIDINSTGGVTAGALAAGSGITVDGTATISLGALTAGNGLIAVNGTGAATDVILGGTVQATNSGLLINQYGIDISAGRDIRVASTSNLTALTSGGIRLQGGRDVNLKVNDFGGNGAGNAVNAVGNLAITAGSGSIFQDDGNVLSLSGANVALTAATAIGALGNITATIGTVNLGAGTSLSTAGHTVTAPGTISFSAPGTVSVSTLNATGATSDISLTSTTANVSGGSLSAGRHITVNAVTGLTMGGSTAGTGGTGLISFGNTGGASDITLNGSLQTTNTGLADNVAAIQVSSGRDILMASTANLTSITSGAIKLTAAGGVNLKVDDFGGNGAGNTINAAGNLDVTATAGAIQSTDGNVMNLAAKAITLTAGGSISPSSGGSIAAGSGNLVLTAGGSINTTNYGMSAAQNLTLTGAGINSSGLTATAGQIDINSTGGVTAGALAAGSGITVDGTATISLGALTAGNGVIAVNGTGAATDVILGGTVQATNSGLLANQYGIDISAGRDIRVASTSNLTALTSGGIRLQGARDVNLKVNDFGGNGAGNAVNAVGNLAITAGSGSIFQDDGDVLSLSGANVTLNAGAGIAPGGTITASTLSATATTGIDLVTAVSSLQLVNTVSGTSQISNTGPLNISGITLGGGSLTLNSTGATSNATGSTIDLQSGAISISNSFTNDGTIKTASGTTFTRTGGFANTGSLTGSGTIDVGAGNTLANTGTISPGVGAGNTATLSIVGILDLAGGQLNIELGGTGAGQFDKLAVSGDVLMGGTLNATQLGGFTPANGDFLPYLTMTGTASGTFASSTLPANFDPGYNLAANEASRLIYSTTGTKTFLNTASDLNWANPTNWSGGALPGAGHSALISAGFAVLHPSGNDTIAALTVNASNSLNISGGSLTVSGATTVDGAMSVSGGTLVLNGTSSVQTLGMTSGALNGSGNVSIANGFNYSGGTVGLSGALDISHTGNLSLPAMTSLTSLLANATGHLILTGNITASGPGNAIVLASGKDFDNSGSHALTASGGRWLVYSQSPATIAKGGLSSVFRHYGSNLAGYAPGSVAEAGNGFIYASAQPSLTADVSLPGATGHIYGDAPTATYGISLTPSSTADNEDIAANFGVNLGGANFRTSVGNLAIDNQLDAGGYLVVANGLASTLGYIISNGITPAYNVTQAPLSITANNQSKVYGDGIAFAGTEFIAGGLKNGQTVGTATLASTGSLTTAGVAGGPYPIVASAATGGSFNAANYNISYVDGSLAVTQRPLTATFSAQSKTYDGNTSASAAGYTLNNLANGETLSLGGTATFDNRNAGTGKTVNFTGLALANGTGNAGNYSIATTATGTGSVTQLASVNWTGTAGDGKWSTAGNWAGGALPDGGNVAAVGLPPGATVNFDAATLATQLDSIAVAAGGSFVMAGSSLTVASSLTTPNYSQTGGTLNGAGSLNVSTSFAKSGGSLALTGLINIAQATGALTIVNNAPLTLGAVSTSSGNILVDTSGGIFTTASPVSANGGTLSFISHSPIVVGSGGVNATGGISLTANSAAADSTITLNGPLASSGGAVNIGAYGNVTQNAAIQGQSISVASTSGNIAVASSAISTVAAGGSIAYSATAGNVTSSASNFSGATPTIASSPAGSGSGSTTNNDIVTAVSKTTDSLTDDVVSTPPPAPTTTDSTSAPVQLASLTQTTGGDSGTFGASTTEPTTSNLTSPQRESTDTSTSAPKQQTGETQETPKELTAEKDKRDEKDEKKEKKDEPQEEKKVERRAAAKKVAQCS